MVFDASWWPEFPVLISSAAVLFLPGFFAALIVRFRGFDALAAAAPLSMATLTAAALINVLIPFRWGLITWLVSCLLLLGIAGGVRWAGGRWGSRPEVPLERTRHTLLRELAPFATALLAALVAAPRLMSAFAPYEISQTFDNIYHLNAARLVLDDGLIAPTRQMLPGFYPDLWHIVVATTSHLSGASIPITVNAVSIVLGAAVWPVGCIWLVRTIAGARIDATFAAGVLSVGMAAFPLLMLDFGVLYPNVMSISLLPSAIAALVLVAGIGCGTRPDEIVRWAMLAAVVPALALAHPSTLMAWLLIAFWIVIIGYTRWAWRARSAGTSDATRLRAGLGVAGVLVVGLALFVVARPDRELAYWPPSANLSDALHQLGTAGLVWRPESWPLVVTTAAGIATVLLLRAWRQHWWLIASLAILAAVYVVCLVWPQGLVRYMITGTWYQDVYRIAALFPALLVPLGALGVVGVSTLCTHLLRSSTNNLTKTLPQVTGVVGALLLLIATQTGAALEVETANTRAMYRQDASSPLLNDDERALIQRIPDHVPTDEVIVGSPWTGTSLSYALVGRKALIPHIFQELSPDMATITQQLNRAASDPAVCQALDRTGTRWVLDFGSEEIHNGDHAYPGLKDLGPDVAELVDRQGNAALYRIIACR